MTVLAKYQRLECGGTWRASEDAQRQNVVVSLGDATLIITDSNDMALAHWSLPAVERVDPGTVPALYRPGADDGELLEIDDPEMIEAIGTVRRAIVRSRPRAGRLRLAILATIATAVLLLGALWLPDALTRQTAEVLPEPTRADIGRRLLADLEPVAGRACRNRAGRRAMAVLQRRLFAEAPWEIVVVPGGPAMSANLPGGILLLHRRMIEDASGPEVTAGALLVEAARVEAADPMIGLMDEAGLGATLRLLTRGTVSDEVLDDHAAELLIRPAATPDPVRVAARFAEAEVPAGPYLAQPGAVDFPPPAVAAQAAPVLSDADWLRLQDICAR